jgi:hypothetical protein
MPQRHRQYVVVFLLLFTGATHTIFPLSYYKAHPKQSHIEGPTSSILNFISRFRDGAAPNNSTKLRHVVSENLLTSNPHNENFASEFEDLQENSQKKSVFTRVKNRAQLSGVKVSKLSGGRGYIIGSETAVEERLGENSNPTRHQPVDLQQFSNTIFPSKTINSNLKSSFAIDHENSRQRIPNSENRDSDCQYFQPFSLPSDQMRPSMKRGTKSVFPHYHPVAGILSTSHTFQHRSGFSAIDLELDPQKYEAMNTLHSTDGAEPSHNPVIIPSISEIHNLEPSIASNGATYHDADSLLKPEMVDSVDIGEKISPSALALPEPVIPAEQPSAIAAGPENGSEGITVQREDSLNLTAVDAADLVESVHALCAQGEVESALEVVRTDLRNISHPQCTAILHEFAMAGRADCAQAALLHMQVVGVEVGVGLDSGTYGELLLAYARDEATRSDEGLDQAFSVLDLMTRGGVDPDLTAFNRLMEACSAAADSVDTWERGLRLLDVMRERGVRPSVETYNTLLEAVGRRGWSRDNGGGLDRGSALLSRMTEDNVTASTDTFNMLMYGCAWAAGAGDGWGGVERGLGFLEAMAEMSAMPDVITFNNLIAACAQVCRRWAKLSKTDFLIGLCSCPVSTCAGSGQRRRCTGS